MLAASCGGCAGAGAAPAWTGAKGGLFGTAAAAWAGAGAGLFGAGGAAAGSAGTGAGLFGSAAAGARFAGAAYAAGGAARGRDTCGAATGCDPGRECTHTNSAMTMPTAVTVAPIDPTIRATSRIVRQRFLFPVEAKVVSYRTMYTIRVGMEPGTLAPVR
jgi:hypothetical protein